MQPFLVAELLVAHVAAAVVTKEDHDRVVGEAFGFALTAAAAGVVNVYVLNKGI